ALVYGITLMIGVILGDVWIGLIPMLFISFGDSATGLIRAYTQRKQVKSWDGTVAMFVVCSIIGFWKLGWYGIFLGIVVSFVKSRLIGTPIVERNSVFVVILGSAIPFNVVKTRPKGVVKVTNSTSIQVLSEPSTETRGIPRVTYEDIGGLHEEIRKTREIIELPLRHPELFQRLGIEPPKGVLLKGPPGCGKTLLARAVASESEANFFSINGPEIMSKFYGESEKRLKGEF
ncbi:unnamed protein product, partial [marine sediment metagenome]